MPCSSSIFSCSVLYWIPSTAIVSSVRHADLMDRACAVLWQRTAIVATYAPIVRPVALCNSRQDAKFKGEVR